MKLLRTGLCVLVLFSVLAHGAVEVWSGSLLEMGAAALLMIWSVLTLTDAKAEIRWNSLGWPLAGFFLIGLAQLAFRATANPFLTRSELLRFAAYMIFFFLVVQAFRERADFVFLLWFLMFLGFAIALLGIIQHFTSPGKIYWLREFPTGGEPFGPFVNRNHFAGFEELVLPLGLALLVFRGLRRDTFSLGVLLTIVPIGAIILSGSRSGIICFGFEVAVLALLARSRRTSEGPRFGVLGPVALAAVALIIWLGAGRAIERFSTLRPGEVSLSRRMMMTRSALQIFLAHPVKGTGLGTIVAVFPQYDRLYDGKVVDHVHNDYVEWLAETGLLGGLCGIAFLWLLYRGAQASFEAEQGHFSRAMHVGAIAAVSGLLLHSLVDFNLHVPSNTLLFLLQASLATSAALPSESTSFSRRSRHRVHAGVAESSGQPPHAAVLRQCPGVSAGGADPILGRAAESALD